jgi:hypothetical protein
MQGRPDQCPGIGNAGKAMTPERQLPSGLVHLDPPRVSGDGRDCSSTPNKEKGRTDFAPSHQNRFLPGRGHVPGGTLDASDNRDTGIALFCWLCNRKFAPGERDPCPECSLTETQQPAAPSRSIQAKQARRRAFFPRSFRRNGEGGVVTFW